MQYARSLSAQALARVMYTVAGAVVFVVLARMLGPAQLGLYVYAVTIITVACSLIDLSATGILARDLINHTSTRPRYLADFIALRAVLSVVVGIGTVAVVLFIAPDELQLSLLLTCPLLLLISARFFDPIFQVAGRPWLSVWLTGGYGVFLLASSVGVVLAFDDPVPNLVLSFALGGAGYGVIGLWLTQRLSRPDFRAVTIAGIVAVAVSIGPFGVSGLFSMLSVRLDVFIIAWLGTVEMVGQFNAAFRFLDLGVAVVITVLTPLVPAFTHLARTDRTALVDAFHAMWRFIVTWSTAIAVLAPTLSPIVVLLLYGPEYAPTAPVLDLLAWKFQIIFCNLLVFALLLALGSINFVWWNALQALVMNLALNVLLIPHMGIVGSGVAAVLSEVGQAAVNMWFLHRYAGNVFLPGFLARIACAAAAAALVVHLPLGLDKLLLAAPALLVYVAIVHFTGGLPSNPITAVSRAEGATNRPVPAPQGGPAA